MNDENDKIVEQTSDIDKSITKDQELNTEVPAAAVDNAPEFKTANIEPSKKDNPSSDISKVKIRDILKQRFKKTKPSLKKTLPIILVGIICFAAGVGVDRAFISRRANNNLRNRPGINQPMPNKRFNGNQGGMRNNQNLPNRFNNNNNSK